MKLFLAYLPSLRFHIGFANSHALERVGKTMFVNCTPTIESANYVKDRFPFVSEHAQFLVPSKDYARKSRCFTTTVSSYDFSDDSFVKIDSGVFALSPELCFVYSALRESPLHAIEVGYMLCGSYAISYPNSSNPGLTARPPLTSVNSIKRYLEHNKGIPGGAAARKLLRYVLDGSASPQESRLAMRLTLPMRLGGCGLPPFVLNYPIDIPKRFHEMAHRRYFVADACYPDQRLVLEYDSDAHHLLSQELTNDALKRSVLRRLGYTVISVTRLQLQSRQEMRALASQIAFYLGIRFRIQSMSFGDRQEKLFSIAKTGPIHQIEAKFEALRKTHDA